MTSNHTTCHSRALMQPFRFQDTSYHTPTTCQMFPDTRQASTTCQVFPDTKETPNLAVKPHTGNHDFWARRTAKRAHEALRAANNRELLNATTQQPTPNIPSQHSATHQPLQLQQPQHHPTPLVVSPNSSACSPTAAAGSDSERRGGERRRRRGSHRTETSRREASNQHVLPTNFSRALSESSLPLPSALLKKLHIREVNGLGKIRVVLRVSPLVRLLENEAAVLILDKKRRQVTLADPQPAINSRLGVTAPKMFAFDQVYSQDDSQSEVVSGAASDILHAVLAGNDGCILCFGASLLGKSYTMVGLHDSGEQFGIIPSSIGWLYKSISELKSKTGARYSVRVSAVAVDATGSVVKDMLEQYSDDSSPTTSSACGVLSSLRELRAATPEAAAHFLDVALAGRSTLALSSVVSRQQLQQPPIFPGSATLVYTLHVFQYSVNSQGGVMGGRSRLHLIDMGDLSARHGSASLSLSSLTSVLLAIFSGQKHIPHRDNRLTGVLREALQSLTCHTALVAHVSPAARHAQHSLTTLQLAARVHRTRTKKLRYLTGGGSSGSSGSRLSSSGETSTSAGSSSLDFSSSEQSCDTVIYLGGGGPGDSTDGEHPPIFLRHHIRQPRLQRLRSLEQLRPHSASPTPSGRRAASASPAPTSRSVPSKPFQRKKLHQPSSSFSSHSFSNNNVSKPLLQAGFIRHQPGVSQVIYPNTLQPLNKAQFLQQMQPVAEFAAGKTNNNNTIDRSGQGENLNFVNGNQPLLPMSRSMDKLHNYNAYQEPYDLVPTALSPNQDISNIQNLRYYQLAQQQLHLQELFQQYSMNERKKLLDKETGASASMEPLETHLVRTHCEAEINRTKLITKSDEQWIDGPRVHKSRVTVNISKENAGEKQDETWVDGPQISTHSSQTQVSAATSSGLPNSYGFMDDHKKSMIEKWVEVQTAQVVNQLSIVNESPSSCEPQTTGYLNNNSQQPSTKLYPKPESFSIPSKKSSVSTNTMPTMCDDLTNSSDADTVSEDPSGSNNATGTQPSLIQELERKNLIPTENHEDFYAESERSEPCLDHIHVSSAEDTNKNVSDCSTKGRGSPETTSLVGELSIDEVCSQCEALAEECEELNSLLSCEEEECKKQVHQGLATVLEEPELESVADDNAGASFCGQSDCVVPVVNCPAADDPAADDGNEADEESSEFGIYSTNAPAPNCSKKKFSKRLPCGQTAKDDSDRCNANTRSYQEYVIDLPAYPVALVDCGTQVCERDLQTASEKCFKQKENLRRSNKYFSNPSSCSDQQEFPETVDCDHPLRVLSEENLTCASTFTDSCSQSEETGDEEFDTEVARGACVQDVAKYINDEILGSTSTEYKNDLASNNILELRKIHELYLELASRDQPWSQNSALWPSSLGEIFGCSNSPNKTKDAVYETIANIGDDINQYQKIENNQRTEKYSLDVGARSISSDKENVQFLKSETSSSLSLLPSQIELEESRNTSSDTPRSTMQEDSKLSLPLNSLNKSSLPKEHLDKLDDCSVAFLSDSDCASNCSEPNYSERTSKLSKFLCVGVRKNKTKAPYKPSKQNFKDEYKKNCKMKDDDRQKLQCALAKSSKKQSPGSPKNLPRSLSATMSQVGTESSCEDFCVDVYGSLGSQKHIAFRSHNAYISHKNNDGFQTNSSFSYKVPLKNASDPNSELFHGVTVGSPTKPRDTWMKSLKGKSRIHQNARGAASGVSSSQGTTPSLGDSSGYGSMARDSECSFSSSQDSEMDDEQKRKEMKSNSGPMPAVVVQNFTEEDIQRYEGRLRIMNGMKNKIS